MKDPELENVAQAFERLVRKSPDSQQAMREFHEYLDRFDLVPSLEQDLDETIVPELFADRMIRDNPMLSQWLDLHEKHLENPEEFKNLDSLVAAMMVKAPRDRPLPQT